MLCADAMMARGIGDDGRSRDARPATITTTANNIGIASNKIGSIGPDSIAIIAARSVQAMFPGLHTLSPRALTAADVHA